MLGQSVTSCCIFSIRCRFMRRSRIFTAHWTSLNLFQIYSCRGSNETCIKHNLKNTLSRMAKKRYGLLSHPLHLSLSPPTSLFFCFQTEHCHQIGTHGRADHLVTMVTGIECHLWVHACTFSYVWIWANTSCAWWRHKGGGQSGLLSSETFGWKRSGVFQTGLSGCDVTHGYLGVTTPPPLQPRPHHSS